MRRLLQPLRIAFPSWGRLALFLALPYLPILLLAWKNAGNVPPVPTLPPPSSTSAGSPDPGVSCTPPGGVHPSPGRSGRWELKPLESPPWKLLMTDHFAIRGDASGRTLRDLGLRAEAAFDEIYDRLGGDPEGIRFSIRAYSNPHEFALLAASAGVPDAASYYDSGQAEAVLHWHPDIPRDPADRTLRHELSHLYMGRVFDRREPLWLCEGIAGWMEGGPARPLERRMSLAVLIRAEREQFYAPGRIKEFYEQSADLIRLLASRTGALERLLRGEALDRVEDLTTLEKAWRAGETASK